MIPARRGRIRLTLDALRAALGLPDGMYIAGIAIDADDLFGGTVTLAVAGPQLAEVDPGLMAPNLYVRLRKAENGRVSILDIEQGLPPTPARPIAEVIAEINETLARERAEAATDCAGGETFDGDPSRTVLGQASQ